MMKSLKETNLHHSTKDIILKSADEYVEHVRNLKMITPYYPAVICSEPKFDGFSMRQSYSTFVRIYRNNQWYRVHVVENFYWEVKEVKDRYSIVSLEQLHHQAYMIQHLCIVQDDTELDPLQIDEDIRLRKIMNKFNKKDEST